MAWTVRDQRVSVDVPLEAEAPRDGGVRGLLDSLGRSNRVVEQLPRDCERDAQQETQQRRDDQVGDRARGDRCCVVVTRVDDRGLDRCTRLTGRRLELPEVTGQLDGLRVGNALSPSRGVVARRDANYCRLFLYDGGELV